MVADHLYCNDFSSRYPIVGSSRRFLMFSKERRLDWKARERGDCHDYNTLRKFSVTGASHDTVELEAPLELFPEAHGAIVPALTNWCRSSRPEDKVLWVYGPPESGRPTVAYTIARCFQDSKLAGSFFFCSSDTERNNTQSFVATLSYQMSQTVPATKRYVVQAIRDDPSIFSKSAEVQAKSLIFRPLKKCRRWFMLSGWPKIMVIDGLDECYDTEEQVSVLRILQSAIQEDIPLRFLLSSQVTPHIRDVFDNTNLLLYSRRIGLDGFQKDRDNIRTFFRKGFTEILRKHKQLGSMAGIPKAWPPPYVLEKLSFASWGNPIYATTVLKYVDSTDSLPTEQLDLALSIRNLDSFTPIAELDLIYKQVLSSAVNIDVIMKLLRALFVLKERIPTSELEILLGLVKGELALLLLDLRPVLNIHKPDGGDSGYITFHHASFPEFLLDQSRSGDYHVDIGHAHGELAMHCIRLMEENISECKMFALVYTALDKCLCYAVAYWLEHLLSSAEDPELYDTIEGWDMSQWGLAVLTNRIFSMEPLMRITEILTSSRNENCPKKYAEGLVQHSARSVDKVLTVFLDEHRDVAATLIPMVVLSIPIECPDYSLRDITKSKPAILWLDTLIQLARYKYFGEFISNPVRSGRYYCSGESHGLAFMMLLNYVRSPVLYACISLEDDVAYDYALSTAAFHLRHATPTQTLISYLENVLRDPDLFSDSWCMEEQYRPNFRRSISRYLKANS